MHKRKFEEEKQRNQSTRIIHFFFLKVNNTRTTIQVYNPLIFRTSLNHSDHQNTRLKQILGHRAKVILLGTRPRVMLKKGEAIAII